MTKKIMITGMSCKHCVAAVTKALKAVAGVKKVKVNLEEGTADIETKDDVSYGVLREAVAGAGFGVSNIK